jgi:hypothetical protein
MFLELVIYNQGAARKKNSRGITIIKTTKSNLKTGQIKKKKSQRAKDQMHK